MFATLGEIHFQIITSPESWRGTLEYSYAEHKVVEAKPRLQWLATDLQHISLELGFHTFFTNPATQMNRLYAAAEDHQARALIFGNGVHRGYFVIESVEENLQQTADDGSLLALTARVELREWIPGKEFDPAAPPKWASPRPGIVQAPGGQQPISANNIVPNSAILQLASAALSLGLTYTPFASFAPGLSGIVGGTIPAIQAGNPSDVAVGTILRRTPL